MSSQPVGQGKLGATGTELGPDFVIVTGCFNSTLVNSSHNSIRGVFVTRQAISLMVVCFGTQALPEVWRCGGPTRARHPVLVFPPSLLSPWFSPSIPWSHLTVLHLLL